MRETRRLLQTVALSRLICAASCADYAFKMQSSTWGLQHKYMGDIVCWMWFYIDFFWSFQVSLSSFTSNEQMLLSCWNQHDRLNCWQGNPSAVRKWERSSGHWTACRRGLDSSVFLIFIFTFLLLSFLTLRFSSNPALPDAVLSNWAPVGHPVWLITYL